MEKYEIKEKIKEAVQLVRENNPMAGSVTNSVTINLVANAQLAVGGSAAMVYLPDEGEFLAQAGDAVYLNMGTLLPVNEETMPRTAKMLQEEGKVCVIDPVGIGIGSLRTKILLDIKPYKPKIIRGNASEIIALASLWGLEGEYGKNSTRGVDSTEEVDAACTAAVSLAKYTGGAVAVSGIEDMVTDGTHIVYSSGGSRMMRNITGAGCSLGGIMAIYACVTTPFIAALTAVSIYNFAGECAEKKAQGPASFQTYFLDALYQASPEEVANNPFWFEEKRDSMRERLDISKYFVIGPENTKGRSVSQMVQAAVDGGFTCIQIRSKEAGAREMIAFCKEAAEVIAKAGKSDRVALLVDDRLDVALAARGQGIKVDGIHVGQSDIPVEVCRKYLGEDAIVGLSAPSKDLIRYVRETDISDIDYFGAGPLRPSVSKKDCGMDETGKIVVRTLEELTDLAAVSSVPIVVGGGVTAEDLPQLAKTGVAGFFVISAIASAEDPDKAAKKLANTWDEASSLHNERAE